jgi:hypothetical protein
VTKKKVKRKKFKVKRKKFVGDTLVGDGTWSYFLQGPFIGRGRAGLYADEPPPVDADEWAREEKAKIDQQRENVILSVGLVFRQRHPDKSAKWIAPKAHKRINELLTARDEPKIKESTVYSCLRKNWARIAPPPKT